MYGIRRAMTDQNETRGHCVAMMSDADAALALRWQLAARQSALGQSAKQQAERRPHDQLRAERRHAELPQHDRRKLSGTSFTAGRSKPASGNDEDIECGHHQVRVPLC